MLHNFEMIPAFIDWPSPPQSFVIMNMTKPLLYLAQGLDAIPKGMVLTLFWSEIGYRL